MDDTNTEDALSPEEEILFREMKAIYDGPPPPPSESNHNKSKAEQPQQGVASFDAEKLPAQQVVEEALEEQPQEEGEQPQEEPLKWRIFSLADAYKKREPTRYLVERFIPEASVTIFHGHPEGHKSTIVYDLVAAAVAGVDWLPGLFGKSTGLATIKSRVLIVDIDQGENLTHERVAAAAKARNIPKDEGFYYVSMPNPRLDMTSPESTQQLREAIRQLDIDIVVIDNLGRVTGIVDENSAAMAKVMGNFRYITDEMGVAIIIIHHSQKGGTAFRGSTSILAAVDTDLRITKEPDCNIVTIVADKTRRAPIPKTRAEFHFTHKYVANSEVDTPQLDTAWFTGEERIETTVLISSVLYRVVEKHGEYQGIENLIKEVYDETRNVPKATKKVVIGVVRDTVKNDSQYIIKEASGQMPWTVKLAHSKT